MWECLLPLNWPLVDFADALCRGGGNWCYFGLLFSDPMVGILTGINLLDLLMLFPTLNRVLSDYHHQLKAGIMNLV